MIETTLKKPGWLLMTLLSLGIVGYAAFTYLQFDPERFPAFMRPSFEAHPSGIYTHVFASILALLLGPFQFLSPLRTRYLALHRWLGRIYLGIGVLIGGLAALYMALFAYGGFPAGLGFAGMAVMWLFTGLMAYLWIRQGQVQAHREWMVRNFALTFAAVTVRTWLFVFLWLTPDLKAAYIAAAWFCWVPNLIVAELIIARPK